MTVVIDIDDAVVATLSGSHYGGSIQIVGTGSFELGVSGSLTRLTDGRTYLLAGSNATIASTSNGQVTLSRTSGASPVDATYICVANDASLSNERALSGTSGVTITDGGANSTITVTMDEAYLDLQYRALLTGYKGGVTFASINDYFGIFQAVVSGLPSYPGTQAGTNLCTRTLGATATTAAGANARCGWYSSAASTAESLFGQDGYWSVHTFGFETLMSSATAKCFFGLKVLGGTTLDSVFSTNEPSSLVDCVGVALDSGETTLQIIHNDSTGACTKVSTGITAANGSVYYLRIQCNAGGTSITWTLNDLSTGAGATGVLSTNLPTSTQALIYEHAISNGAAGGAVAFRNIGTMLSANAENMGWTQF